MAKRLQTPLVLQRLPRGLKGVHLRGPGVADRVEADPVRRRDRGQEPWLEDVGETSRGSGTLGSGTGCRSSLCSL